MNIRGLRKPGIFEYGIFMTTSQPQTQGIRMKPELAKPGRPEIIKNILVVDDTMGVLKATKRLLSRLGIEITLIDPDLDIRGQVLQMAADAKYDLVIMDGQMPGILGHQLTREIREKGYNGYIVANSSDLNEQDKIMAAGADINNSFKIITQLTALFAT